MSLPTTVVAGALTLSGITYCASTLVLWRRRSAPASSEFAVATGVAGIGALAIAATVLFAPVNTLAAAVLVTFLLPIPWIVFAFEYTGRDGLRSPQAVSSIVAPVVLGLLPTVLVLVDRLFPWLAVPTEGNATGMVAVAIFILTIVEGITLLYAGGMVLIATGLLLWAFHQYEHLDPTSGVYVGVFGSVPWLALLFGFQVNDAVALALPASVSIGFLVGAVAVGMLVVRGQLFERLPAAGNIGPTTIIRELNDGVLVTDAEGTVIQFNTAAERMLAGSRIDPLGSDVTELLGNTPVELSGQDNLELRSNAGRRLFDPDVSELTDQHGRVLGYAVVLHDVTDRTIREQRLEVLNRVLRHNLRNDSMVIMGNSQMIVEDSADPSVVRLAETVVETGRQLADLSETARDIDNLLAAADAESTEMSVVTIVEDVLAAASDEGSVRCDVPDGLIVTVAQDLLEIALSELVENALEHNDSDNPHVTVHARYAPDEDYPVTLSVVDDGPGIPDMEREVIREGVETPLHHGSGLGLWLVHWSIVRAGGDLDIADNDPRGTVVSLRLPEGRLSESEHVATGQMTS